MAMQELHFDDVKKAYAGDLKELEGKLAAIAGAPNPPITPAEIHVRENLDLGIVEMQVADEQFVFTAKQAQDLALTLRMAARRIELHVLQATRPERKKKRRR